MPAPPLPPPPPTSSAPSAGKNDHGLLLQSIRAGKTLKKTVTVDKSAPAISGRIKEERSSSVGPSSRGNIGGRGATAGVAPNLGGNVAGGPPNLGGLFAGGMPKLKARGLRSSIADDREASPNGSSIGSCARRGPPPVPPPTSLKPQASAETASPEPIAKVSFGKPMLAPKPPNGVGSQKPSPPPKKFNLLNGQSVSRAHSMRLPPRSPPVLAPVPSTLHQSQDFLNETMQQQQQQQQQHRPMMNRVLRPPIARPPSPPTSRVTSSVATRIAPVPPSRLAVTAPSMPPPPPPYRSTSIHQRLAPPPPPTPPTRIASAVSSTLPRNGPTVILDLELRFTDKFHSIMNFPNPAPFRGFTKVYNSKNAAKQQAPAPPLQSTSAPGTMLRLNASSGGKQWQHNAASSAC